jgi:hypothetical protein
MNRLLRFVVAAVSLVCLTASRADAHAAGNTPASNYVSRVISVKPATTTFTVKTIEAGARLEVRWKSGPELAIADYDGYPYLRVGPQGVFENQQSNAVYLNATRSGGGRIPDGLNPAGPPEWKKISDGTVARFHDHRAHYMGTEPPPEVRAAKNRPHLVQRNDVEITQGGTTHVVDVEVRWKPGPSPFPLLAVASIVAVASLALVVVNAKAGRARSAIGVFSALLVVLVVVDAVHLFGIAFGVRGGSGLSRVLSIGWASLAAWAVVGVSIALLLRQKFDALYACVFAAGVITLVGGLSDISVLSSSSVPFAFANGVARMSISLTLALGIAAIVAGVLLTGSPIGQRNTDASSVEPSDELTSSP